MAGLDKWLSDPIGAAIGKVTNSKTVQGGKDAVVDGVTDAFKEACIAPARDTSVPVMTCEQLNQFDFDKVEDILKTIPADKINITSAKSQLGEFLQKSLNALDIKTGVDGAAGGGTVKNLNIFFANKVASEADNVSVMGIGADKFSDLKTINNITQLTGRHVQAIVNALEDNNLLEDNPVLARELGEGLRNIDSPELAALADQLAPKKSEWVEPKADATAPTTSASKVATSNAIAVPSSSLLGTIEDGLKDNVTASDITVSASNPSDMGKFIQGALNKLNADNGMNDKITVTGVIGAGTIAKINEFLIEKTGKESGNMFADKFDDLKQIKGADDISGRTVQALLHDLRGDTMDKEPDVISNDPDLVRSLSAALSNDVNNISLGNAAGELVKPPEPEAGKIGVGDITEGAGNLLNKGLGLIN